MNVMSKAPPALVVPTYFDELTRAMTRLAQLDSRAVFVGQGVGCAGTSMTDTLKGVPRERLLEFPVAEDLQAGFCLGLSLEGYTPICIYPRWNFLICATNQIVNHIDKLPLFSSYKSKVIIRTAIATDQPIDPGPQHLGDYTDAFRSMLKTVEVFRMRRADDIVPTYEAALRSDRSSLIVEFTDAYYSTQPSGVPG